MFRFPPIEDIRLKKAPLDEVICQVRFPQILRIGEEKPVDFQEQIRRRLPVLDVEREIEVRVPSQEISQPSAQASPPVFRFKSSDEKTIVSLAPHFYALSTKVYTHWRDFLEFVQLVNNAACAVYDLPYATRIGLRYVNRLTFENTQTNSVRDLWGIVRSELTVLLRENCWDDPLEMLNQLLLAGEGDERLRLRMGFRKEDDPFFLLDFDCYVEGNKPLEELMSLCNRFHDVIYRAFRWCIEDDQLDVFEPVAVVEEV